MERKARSQRREPGDRRAIPLQVVDSRCQCQAASAGRRSVNSASNLILGGTSIERKRDLRAELSM